MNRDVFLGPRLQLIERDSISGGHALVLGATGWFGRSAAELLVLAGYQVMLVASKPKSMKIGNRIHDVIQWDHKKAADFGPHIVVDAAFVTREHLANMGNLKFMATNRRIMNNAFEAFTLPSVKRFLGFSSGVVSEHKVITPDSDPYAFLKREYEDEINRLFKAFPKSATVLRVFSVSGPHINRSHEFAFSSFLEGARNGQISIQSSQQIYRRYCSIDDLLALCLAHSAMEYRVLESGGELIELGDLAKTICLIVNPKAKIVRNLTSNSSSTYASDNSDWLQLVSSNNFEALDINSQIREMLS